MFRHLVFVVIATCGFAFPSQKRTAIPVLDGRIVGGTAIGIEEVPYQASLLYYGYHICGASVISDRWVITAAHCTDGSVERVLSIRVGSSYHNFGGTVVGIEKLHQHPSYDPFYIDYDIALCRLSQNLNLGLTVGVIALSELNQVIPEGVESLVSGWGATTEGGTSSTQLQAVTVSTVSHLECRRAYGRNAVTDRMICAAEKGKDSCQGDSGGPLVHNGVLIGVVSWGYGCARPRFPGVYASVPNLRGFISEVFGE